MSADNRSITLGGRFVLAFGLTVVPALALLLGQELGKDMGKADTPSRISSMFHGRAVDCSKIPAGATVDNDAQQIVSVRSASYACPVLK